jgi:hypothetical protein
MSKREQKKKAELTPTVITFSFESFGEHGHKMLVAKINDKTYSLNTLIEYVPDWGVAEGAREYEQNRIDQERRGFETWTKTDDKRNVIDFWTSSTLPVEALAYGFTTKRDEPDTIGFFGDGFKKGTLAFRRAGVDIRIMIGSEGTLQTITFPKRTQFLEAKRFLEKGFLREGFDEKQILSDRPGELFVNGVFVKKIESKFGVNMVLPKGEHLDSDRNIIEESTLFREIGDILADETDNKDAIRAYITGEDKTLGNATISSWNLEYLDESRKKLWRRVWHDEFGEDAVIATSREMRAQAEYEGAKVVTLEEDKSEALQALIPTDKKWYFEKRKTKFIKVRVRDLDQKQQKLLTALKRFVETFFGEEKEIKIIPVISDENWKALGEQGGKTMWIKTEVLRDVEEAVHSVIHELTHVIGGAGDNVQEQVQAALNVATKIAILYVKQEME